MEPHQPARALPVIVYIILLFLNKLARNLHYNRFSEFRGHFIMSWVTVAIINHPPWDCEGGDAKIVELLPRVQLLPGIHSREGQLGHDRGCAQCIQLQVL